LGQGVSTHWPPLHKSKVPGPQEVSLPVHCGASNHAAYRLMVLIVRERGDQGRGVRLARPCGP
jgi:hypothetical protein